MTAPTGRQIKGILWREVRRLYYKARKSLGGELSRDPGTGFRFNDGRELVGFATNEPERMSGYSGAELFYIIDEASGIDEAIFEAIQGNRAGGAKFLMTSNPTQVSGTFYDAFTAKKALYAAHHISCYDSPNVKAGKIVIPGLATLPWIHERQEDWGGEGSPIFDVRVLGNFPQEAWNTIIPLLLMEKARQNWTGEPVSQPLTLGVDVGRYGDDESIVFPVRGFTAYPCRSFRQLDGPQLAGKVLEVAFELKRPGEVPRVNIDVSGVGSSPYDDLKRAKGIIVRPVNSAENAIRKDEYYNRRTELLFDLRDWLKEGGTIPADPKLEAEMVSAKYDFDRHARPQAEPKDEIKKRLGRSPDRADALALAVARVKRELPADLELDFDANKYPIDGRRRSHDD